MSRRRTPVVLASVMAMPVVLASVQVSLVALASVMVPRAVPTGTAAAHRTASA